MLFAAVHSPLLTVVSTGRRIAIHSFPFQDRVLRRSVEPADQSGQSRVLARGGLSAYDLKRTSDTHNLCANLSRYYALL